MSLDKTIKEAKAHGTYFKYKCPHCRKELKITVTTEATAIHIERG